MAKSYIKHYTIGPSSNQVLTLVILAGIGGAAAMYFVPQLPQLIGGLFKGTETPKSVIEKIKVQTSKPKQQTQTVRPSPTSNIPRTPPKTPTGNTGRRANYTYYYQNYL